MTFTDAHPGNINKHAETLFTHEMQEALLSLMQHEMTAFIPTTYLSEVSKLFVHEYLNCALPFAKKVVEKLKVPMGTLRGLLDQQRDIL